LPTSIKEINLQKKTSIKTLFTMQLQKEMNYSYWELKRYFNPFDIIIIGSGIVGLSTALSCRKKNKKARILILERGIMPDGASSKNAGFACFGSVSELIDDLDKMDEDVVWETVKMRWEGLNMLRKRIGDKNLDYKKYGGFELFDKENNYLYYREKSEYLNKKITECLGIKNCYSDVPVKPMPFNRVTGVLRNNYEGQIDTDLMMQSLLSLAHINDILILNNIQVSAIKDLNNRVELQTAQGVFKATKVVVATNGFATDLLKIKDVKPARAQVLITKPIKNLAIKGAFHYQQGYFYFRNINHRLLFGGGRNLDPDIETTSMNGLNKTIQTQLDKLLKTMVLPNTRYEVEHRWTGIMGIGNEKKPIIRPVSDNVLAAVRMGGMGIAIGSLVGQYAAKEIM